MDMQAFWRDDVVSHGPWGIGSRYSFRAFQDYPYIVSHPAVRRSAWT